MLKEREENQGIIDNYNAIRQICQSSASSSPANTIIVDSLELVPLDVSFPDLKVKSYQKSQILRCTDPRQCARLLLTVLIGQSSLMNNSFKSLDESYPKEMKLIETFVMNKFDIKKCEYTKCISNFCRSLTKKI